MNLSASRGARLLAALLLILALEGQAAPCRGYLSFLNQEGQHK